MEFHEGYWVTVGTAAPVIALALCVGAGTSSAAIHRKVRGTRQGEKLYRSSHRMSAFAAMFGVILTLTTLILALTALGTESDLGNWFFLGGFLTVLALVMVFAVTTTAADAAIWVKLDAEQPSDD